MVVNNSKREIGILRNLSFAEQKEFLEIELKQFQLKRQYKVIANFKK